MRDPAFGGSRANWGVAGAALDLAQFGLALAAVALIFGYLPLGVLAAVCQDGLSQSMRGGLGHEAPLPLRVFQQVRLHVALGAGLLVALLHVGQRRLLRRGLAFGDSLPWDVLSSPLVTAVVAALVVMLVQARRHGPSANIVVQSGVFVFIAALMALALAGLCLALVRRQPRLGTLLTTAIVVAVVARLGAEAWGRTALASYRSHEAAGWAAVDARRAARERPLLREPAIDEDAWPRYRKLIDAVRASDDRDRPLGALTGLGDLGAFEPVPSAAKAVLDARRAEVLALREATHCRRSLPEIATNPVAPIPSLFGVRQLAILAELEGHERAQAGDLEGAALRYLEIVRFGGDIGDGNLIHGLLGTALEQRGLRALGRLVHSGRLAAAPLASIGRDVALLEAHRASLVESLGSERRSLASLGDALDGWEAAFGEPLVLPAVVPYRALAARAQLVADPLCRQLQDALAKDDLEAWREWSARTDAVAGSSWNPLLRLAMGYNGLDSGGTNSMRLFLNGRRQLAYFRLVEAALKLELEKKTHGRYPSDAAALELPRDPFAPQQTLRYALDGTSYRLWSVGIDGVDDGGVAKNEADVVL